MNFKKNWKRFWTLNRHAEGFTLVELIVVIAILAILAAVAVPAYSAYVTKANISADEQLFSEIEYAIYLAHYANPNTSYAGYIGLGGEGTSAKASSNALSDALEASFGNNWESQLTLKYTEGWTSAAYMNSSFAGDEVVLLETVDDLTTALQDLIASNGTLVGERFDDFYTKLGIGSDEYAKIADAAVLYVAQDSVNMTTEQRTGAINVMSNLNQGDALTALAPYFNNSVVAASAAYYAMFEAYCRYASNKGYTAAYDTLGTASFGNDTNKAVIEKLVPVMKKVAEDDDAGISTYFDEYWGSAAAKTDAAAYLDLMTTVNSAQSQVLQSGNIGSDGFFSNQNLIELFQMIAEGGAVIIVNEVDNSLIVTLPELN